MESSKLFEILIARQNEHKADNKEALEAVREEMREIKKLVTENRDFRLKFAGAALALQFIIGLIWKYIELSGK